MIQKTFILPFQFWVAPNRDFGKLPENCLSEIFRLTQFSPSLSNFYNELLISTIFFSITPLNVKKQPFKLVLQKIFQRNLRKIKEKHLSRTLYFNAVASPGSPPCNKTIPRKIFFGKVCKIFRNSFFTE